VIGSSVSDARILRFKMRLAELVPEQSSPPSFGKRYPARPGIETSNGEKNPPSLEKAKWFF